MTLIGAPPRVAAMGLAADLGYRHSPPNAFQRAMQTIGSTRPGAWSFSHSLRHVDRLMYRLTGGRRSAPELLAGLPVVMVTTTGRKSGQPRTTPLIAPPVADTLALVGTNFGQHTTPAWVLNLEADPRATVEFHGTKIEAWARPATAEEAVEIWDRASAVYGGYGKYQERITGRDIRIFVLDLRGRDTGWVSDEG
jgi:deazaflavin-dependent oxidoreductase (nitroreductase family)